MKNTFLRIIITLSAIIAAMSLSAQTYPTRKLQRQMHTEEREFLSNMKPGLQHTQMLAVRAAIQGDDTALQQIRQSRNLAPTLPETIAATCVTPDLCLFVPVNAASRKRPLFALSTWRRMVLWQHKQLCPFLCSIGRSRGLLRCSLELSAVTEIPISGTAKRLCASIFISKTTCGRMGL